MELDLLRWHNVPKPRLQRP